MGENRKLVNSILKKTARRAQPVDAMAFHRWAATKGLEPSERTSFQALWNVLVAGSESTAQCANLLDEVFDFFDRKMEELRRHDHF